MRCTPAFFETRELPSLTLSREVLDQLAQQNVSQGLTVPGVQRKISLHLEDMDDPRLTIVNYPTGYILKPQTPAFPHLPEAEDLVMDMAQATGIQTVPHGLIEADGELAYVTRRVDRTIRKGELNEMYAMEDFCQLSGRLTQDKYKGSYERCAGIIRQYSMRPGYDLSELFLRLIVCFITGNSDMHLKNFSLIEIAPRRREYVLSPAYDLLPVNLVMPEDQEQTALTLNGKKARLKASDFLKFAKSCEIPAAAASKMLRKCISMLPEYTRLCDHSFLPQELKDSMIQLMTERVEILAKGAADYELD